MFLSIYYPRNEATIDNLPLSLAYSFFLWEIIVYIFMLFYSILIFTYDVIIINSKLYYRKCVGKRVFFTTSKRIKIQHKPNLLLKISLY